PRAEVRMSITSVVLAYVVLKSGNGAELHWNTTPVNHVISTVGIPGSVSNAPATIDTSFASWNAACKVGYISNGTTSMDFHSVYGGGTVNSGNETHDGTNLVTWLTSGWPYGAGIIGITFTWFDPQGNISEADMLFNGQDYSWTNSDVAPLTDLQAIATHEAGHFLGLGHTPVVDATMYATVQQGETKKRSLDPDDIAGAQHLYNGTGGPGNTTQSPACGCDLEGHDRRASIGGALVLAAL